MHPLSLSLDTNFTVQSCATAETATSDDQLHCRA